MLFNLAFLLLHCAWLCLHPGYKTLKQVVQSFSGGSGANEGLPCFAFKDLAANPLDFAVFGCETHNCNNVLTLKL